MPDDIWTEWPGGSAESEIRNVLMDHSGGDYGFDELMAVVRSVVKVEREACAQELERLAVRAVNVDDAARAMLVAAAVTLRARVSTRPLHVRTSNNG